MSFFNFSNFTPYRERANREELTRPLLLRNSSPIYQFLYTNLPSVDVFLPLHPYKGSRFQIRKIDGGTGDIIVRTSSETLILDQHRIQVECIYDGVEWQMLIC